MKRIGTFIWIPAIALLVGILSYQPLSQYDTYFGIKLGERIIATKRIDTTEIFSWSALGRHGNAYEWLSHTLTYLVYRFGGITALQFAVSFFAACSILLCVWIARSVFRRGIALSVLLSLATYALIYEYIVARPQTISFLFFPITVAAAISPSVPLLIGTVLVMYLWTNMHASFVLGIYMLVFGVINAGIRHKTDTLRILLIFSLLSIFVTLLPPIAPAQYDLLFQFIGDRRFLSSFISEWAPITTTPYLFVTYTVVVLAIGTLLFTRWRYVRSDFRWVMALPLVGILILGATAVRHVPYGVMSAMYLFLYLLPRDNPHKRVNILPALLILTLSAMLITEKRNEVFRQARTMPVHAVNFLSTHHLSGYMFNHMAMGGYLMYALPDYRIFMDGRAEVYRCCEMRAYYPILASKGKDDDVFTGAVRHFMDSYRFSYALLPLSAHDPAHPTANERMADYLMVSPDWQLTYFDDQAVLLLKRDNANTEIRTAYNFSYIPLYRAHTPSPISAEQIARLTSFLHEYPSSIGWTLLGDMLSTSTKTGEAVTSYTNALAIDGENGRAYLGQSRIDLAANNLSDAAKNARLAMRYAPYLGESYRILATVYRKNGEPAMSKRILNEGLHNTTDLLERQHILKQLIETTD
jgi:hypothetical protein